MAGDPRTTLVVVSEILERLGISHLVGGSVASSLMGEVRSTEDVDFVADLRLEDVAQLVQAMRRDFYLDEVTIAEAVRRGASFNVIHLATMIKVDVYPVRDAHVREEMRRRYCATVPSIPERAIYLPTPEDLVLRKLEWFSRGHGISDRQWRDVLGVLKVRCDELDLAYMRSWAPALGVAELLERALVEAGMGGR
jgi:hypothetical protein